MSILSLISLAVSILGAVVYTSLFKGSGLALLFVILSIVSLILPPIAKKIRIKNGKKGSIFEILAIIIGGFNYSFVILALTKLPLIIGYLGWVVCGIAYKYVK